jgi:hypothetical protein
MFSHSQHFVKLIPYLIIIHIYLATCFGTKCHYQANVKTNDFLYNAMILFSVVGSDYVVFILVSKCLKTKYILSLKR